MPGNDILSLGNFGPDSPYADLRWPLYDPSGIIQQPRPDDRYPQPNWPWPDINVNIPVGGGGGNNGGGGNSGGGGTGSSTATGGFGVDDFLKQWLPTIILG